MAILNSPQNDGEPAAVVVSETVFLRDIQADLAPYRAARENILVNSQSATFNAALLEIGQPPLNDQARLEVSLQVIIPNTSPLQIHKVRITPKCDCAECLRLQGLQVQIGNENRFYVSGICGKGETAYDQTREMFRLAEQLLQQAGFQFSDVVRTWIHLREMDRDYGALNQARREFFNSREINPVPASTGIEGAQTCASHDLSLGLYAVKSAQPHLRGVMTSPTLNEAGEYGADFVRGMKMEESNKVALHVSGTASINEHGETAHVGDFEAQVDRMLINVAALLEQQNATFEDIVSATTYLKHRADTPRLQEKFRQTGFGGFPNVLVEARVCRPDLLCETEVLAIRPKPKPDAH